MKKITYLITFIFLFICHGCSVSQKKVRFEIKKEDPAVGITIGWLMPEAQLQKIVGDQFKPTVKDGKGFLMLFIASTPKYSIDNNTYNELKLAHIVVPVEGKNHINAPLSIVPKDQTLNKTLKLFGFKMETGKIDMNMTEKNDSISVYAQITTNTGNIIFNATFLNKPSEVKNIDSTTITATNHANSFFAGPESYRPIQIPSIKIEHTGKNWITELGLTSTPDRIWMNIDFVWDFMFRRK